MSNQSDKTMTIFSPYSAVYLKKLHELQAMLNAAKERIHELELLVEDLENYDLEDQPKQECNHEDDEIIFDWVAQLVSESRFKGADYFLGCLEDAAIKGGEVFSPELKAELHVK